MTKLITALEARTQLGRLLSRVASQKERYLINRRGRPTAVILSVEDYLRNIVKTPEILVEIQREAVLKKKDKLTLEDIDREIGAYRRVKRGRK